LSDLLGIGKTGLFTSKKSMETTGHNISNVNTEGYSRQRANQTTERSIVQSGLVKGTGSRIVSVGRIHDDFIEKRLNKELNNTEFLKERSGKLEQIESIFNEVDTEGLNTLLNKFFNSFKELSGQPENETMKMVVRDNAKIVIRDFQRIQNTLTNTRKSIDQNFKTKIADANSLINNIAHLNKEIVRIEQLGGESGDLRDGRDKSIRELSKIFEIHTYVDNRNNFAVAAKGVGTLVVAGEKTDLVAGPATKDIATNGIDGSFEIFYKDRPGFPITNRFQGGQITSLIKIRNEDIQNISEKINNLAYDFAKIVNSIHNKGYVSRKIETDPSGNPLPYDKIGKTTGINFFQEPIRGQNTIEHLSLSEEVLDDPTNICVGLTANASGDNRVALAISKIQHEKLLNGGTTTIEEEYLHTVSQLGLEAAKSNFDLEQAEGILAQTNNIRERISGVSLDEETANMMRYQHAYAASAKVMKVAEEMFETILSIKR